MHVSQIPRVDRDRRLAKSLAMGDRVRRSRTNPQVWLVSSATYPNVWCRVTANSCGCKGFAHDGICRHMVRAWHEATHPAADPRPAA